MVIRIKKVDYDSIVRYCLDGLPNESCGLIAGFTDGDVKVIEKVYFLTNLDHNNVHFTMDPSQGCKKSWINHAWKLSFTPGNSFKTFRGG